MKKASEPAVTTSATPVEDKTKKYWELKIPRVNFKNTSSNPFLVLTLIIFAFFLGMLTNKVMYLEQEKNAQANTAVNAADTGQVIATPAPPPQVVKIDAGTLPVNGDKNAKVTIVEFSDFECPFCKQYYEATHSQIQEKYVKTGKVKFAYRHYPLTTIHPNAQVAAEASECANEQNKFWEYHDLLFQNQEAWSQQSETAVVDSLTDYASQLSLNTDQFRTCVEEHKYKKKVDDDATAGAGVQVDGTPAFFVNGYRITGAVPFSEFEQVIEEQLKK